MELKNHSANLLSLDGNALIGRTIVGHPNGEHPSRILGTITEVAIHKESYVIHYQKADGSKAGVSLNRATWFYDGEGCLVHRTPRDGARSAQHVRYTAHPS